MAKEAADMFRRAISTFAMCAAVLGGLALTPSIATAQAGVELKFYDRSHKDYHQWNGDEDRMYHQYVTDHHMKYREFSRMSKKQQDAYWRWRHSHS
jgi:hypothetical protein